MKRHTLAWGAVLALLATNRVPSVPAQCSGCHPGCRECWDPPCGMSGCPYPRSVQWAPIKARFCAGAAGCSWCSYEDHPAAIPVCVGDVIVCDAAMSEDQDGWYDGTEPQMRGDCLCCFSWSVTKDGQPVNPPPGTLWCGWNFAFTPPEPATYQITVNVDDAPCYYNDAPACATMTFCVYTVDVDVDALTEQTEDDPGLTIDRNGDFDEENHPQGAGDLRHDYEENWNGQAYAHRIKTADNELDTLQLHLSNCALEGYWTINVSSEPGGTGQVIVWKKRPATPNNPKDDPPYSQYPAPPYDYIDVTSRRFHGASSECLVLEGIAGSAMLKELHISATFSPDLCPSAFCTADSVTVTVFAADPVLSTTSFTGRNVGKVIVKNDDDDNYNGISDLGEINVQHETNLRALTLTWTPTMLPMYLRKGSGAEKIKVWRGSEKTDEVTFNGTDNRFTDPPKVVYVEGVLPSAVMNDIEVFGNHDNSDKKAGLEKLTVLWVDAWYFRTTTAELFSNDNYPWTIPSFRDPNYALPVDLRCGLHMYADRAGLGAEVKAIAPSDFNQLIATEREVGGAYYHDMGAGSTLDPWSSRSFANPNFLNRVVATPPGYDTQPGANDPNPQSDQSHGAIYDWDPPGIWNGHAQYETARTRGNLVFWPRFYDERCGPLGYYSIAMSMRPTTQPAQLSLADMPFEQTYQGNGDNVDLRNGMDMQTVFRKCLAYDLVSQQYNYWCPLTVQSGALAGATVGIRYAEANGEVVVVPTVGGIPPLGYSFSGALPPGLFLHPLTGAIRGTPAPGSGGQQYAFTIRVEDSRQPNVMSNTGAFTINVSP